MRPLVPVVALLMAATAQAASQETGPNWSGPIAEAFFVDAEGAPLRPEPEIRAAWDGLAEADRAQVRRDCAALALDARALEGAATGGLADAPRPRPSAVEPEPAGDGSEAYLEACALAERL